MAINVNALAAYVDQLSQPIISKAILESNTLKYVDIIQGVKNSDSFNIMDLNPFTVQLNNASSNGFTDSGTTLMTQVFLQVCDLKLNNSFILEGNGSLEQTYLGMLQRIGSYQDDFPTFEDAFMGLVSKYVSQATDYAVWLGSYNPYAIQYTGTSNTGQTGHLSDTAGTGTTGNWQYLAGCQGLLYNILNQTSMSGATVVPYSGAPTVATIYNIIDLITGAIPNNMLMEKNISIWCQPQYIDMYRRALINLNLFHYAPDSFTTGDLNLTVIGRNNVTLRGTIGLAGPSGSGYQGFICTNDDNIAVGVDLLNDYEKTHVWKSYDFDQLRATTKWKIASTVKFPSQVIVY